MVYYGLSLSTSDLGGNVYISFFISGAVEIPAYLLCIPAIESPLGRRYSTAAFQFLGGVACLATIVIRKYMSHVTTQGWVSMVITKA